MIRQSRRNLSFFWTFIANFLASKREETKYNHIRGNMILWLSRIDKIDSDILGWIMESLPYISETNKFFIPEYLLLHVRQTPEYVGKILYELAKNGVYLTYKKEELVQLIDTLYVLGKNELATRIGHLYLEGGYDFLRETCQKHIDNKSTT
jgi:hypothetical protein